MTKISDSGLIVLRDQYGPTSKQIQVVLAEPITGDVNLMYGISLLDTNHDHNTRVDLEPSSVTGSGFTMSVTTADDSITYNLHISWIMVKASVSDGY